MAKEQIKAFLEKLNADPAARSLLEGKEQPKSEEEKIRKYAEAAAALGFQVTAAEMAEYFMEALTARLEKTDAQAEVIRQLDDNEIEKVSGGKKDKSACRDTYQDKENCWYNDGCDQNWQYYPDYLCNHNDLGFHCAKTENYNCQQVIKVNQ